MNLVLGSCRAPNQAERKNGQNNIDRNRRTIQMTVGNTGRRRVQYQSPIQSYILNIGGFSARLASSSALGCNTSGVSMPSRVYGVTMIMAASNSDRIRAIVYPIILRPFLAPENERECLTRAEEGKRPNP